MTFIQRIKSIKIFPFRLSLLKFKTVHLARGKSQSAIYDIASPKKRRWTCYSTFERLLLPNPNKVST